MVMKHTEFMKLTQGNKSLTEYLQAFNNLARYATEFVDTDAKKIASFKHGLSPKLMKTMGTSKCATFNELFMLLLRAVRGPLRRVLHSPKL
jgi:hypothetical protein